MISREELNYVDNHARYAPFPGKDYARSVIDQLNNSIELYMKYYLNKKCNIIMSNGNEICFEILLKNIAHLLGIDFQNIASPAMELTKNKVLGSDSKNSFEILKAIIDHGDNVIKNDSNPYNFKLLNYYKIMIKCTIFSNLSNFNCFNFGCINFNKETYCALREENNHFTPQSSVFLVTETAEANVPYGMIGLKFDDINMNFVPETLFAPTNFPDFFDNQELLIPIQMLINDNQQILKLNATNEEKLYILKMYKYIINSYKTNSFINLYTDYENMLQSSINNSLVKKR